MGGRGCSEVRLFAAASLTAACAAACPPHLSSSGAGTCPAWKKVLLQQVGRALALRFAEGSGTGSTTAARRRLGCCSSSADAAGRMLWLLQPGKIRADPSREQRSRQHPRTRPRHSPERGLGRELDPLQPQEPPGAPHPFPAPWPSLQFNPDPLHQLEAGNRDTRGR